MSEFLRAEDALKHYFGFDRFLDGQKEVVESILSGDDVGVIMPTGAGKSICYQLPILMKEGYGIVASPLIALMCDQVEALCQRGIAATYVNSTLDLAEQHRRLSAAVRGEIKLLYVAPERFQTDFFRSVLRETPPSVLVVDEAHCISQWGHDFRPAYRKIGQVADEFNIPQVCAFTATATHTVREDIKRQLHRPQMRMVVRGFRRPNLGFEVKECRTDADKLAAIEAVLKQKEPTIIYAATRQAVDELSGKLNIRGYHAGMTPAERAASQEYFMTDPSPVLAATNAFGMGIDRPDVRCVVHYNLPGSLEAYYQEAGRAGRDGKNSRCILLFSYADRYVQEFLIDLSNPEYETVLSVYNALRRIAVQRNTNVLNETPSTLLPLVPHIKNDGHISASLILLERAGAIRREALRRSSGKMRFTQNINQLRMIHQLANTQRSRFIIRCIERYGERLNGTEEYFIDELAAVCGLNEEQVKRVIAALKGECLEWQSSFSGRAIELLTPDVAVPQLDRDAMEDKRDYERGKLEEVINFARHSRGCRQAELISYFGESTPDWKCGLCDCCNTQNSFRELNEYETAVARAVISGVACFDGRIGAALLAKVLTGHDSIEGFRRRSPAFGVLRREKQNVVLNYISAAERAGYLERQDCSGYPCLALTHEGREVLISSSAIFMPLGESKSSAPEKGKKSSSQKSSAAAGSSGHDLLSVLTALRNKIADAEKVPRFKILSNATLEEIARVMPSTPEEAAQISGIGPVKLRRIMPAMLEAIRLWKLAK
ncbi:MAG: RecQ family ATP-dependent DNA helicase [Lentisphaeria bacterium]|nr:RecQ family ATP-dependent DNA helicase [Lentisphaeria bacterium]